MFFKFNIWIYYTQRPNNKFKTLKFDFIKTHPMPQKYQNPKNINLLSLITLITILKTFDIKPKNLSF